MNAKILLKKMRRGKYNHPLRHAENKSEINAENFLDINPNKILKNKHKSDELNK